LRSDSRALVVIQLQRVMKNAICCVSHDLILPAAASLGLGAATERLG
jgi:hypothetical protein